MGSKRLTFLFLEIAFSAPKALCFLEVGSAFVPGKPWERHSEGGALGPRRVDDVALLPEDAKEVLASLLDAADREA